ncbi:amphi-Trp domain-containing protein [Psychrobacter jeotgali]|uniref:amphi-Trp domain-containing protein n=1 Tax=Psychrobacter jeotgali TaxID=179010 RepID=UPI0019195A09|nr:amphi-Trp domain-containing protein [Psychrobacter jeotgali]
MGKETRLFKSKERKSREEVVTFLHELADKISTGAVTLSQGTEELQLELPENLVLEVQVEDEEKKTKGTEHSLEVELKWYDNDQSAAALKLK